MSLFNKVTKSFQWGDKTVVLATGEIARQAGGAGGWSASQNTMPFQGSSGGTSLE